MKNLLICLVLAVGIYQHWDKLKPHASSLSYAPGSPYVVVYGRDSCGYTGQMRAGLAREGLEFDYQRVDEAAVADSLHRKMESLGISTLRYDLPVVEVNGQLFVRPQQAEVLRLYREG